MRVCTVGILLIVSACASVPRHINPSSLGASVTKSSGDKVPRTFYIVLPASADVDRTVEIYDAGSERTTGSFTIERPASFIAKELERALSPVVDAVHIVDKDPGISQDKAIVAHLDLTQLSVQIEYSVGADDGADITPVQPSKQQGNLLDEVPDTANTKRPPLGACGESSYARHVQTYSLKGENGETTQRLMAVVRLAAGLNIARYSKAGSVHYTYSLDAESPHRDKDLSDLRSMLKTTFERSVAAFTDNGAARLKWLITEPELVPCK